LIRRLRAGDETLLQRLATRFKEHVPTEEAAHEFLADHRHLVFAALDDEEVLGFAYGYLLPRIDGRTAAFFYELEVGEEHRRRGLGRALTEAMLEEARASGADHVWVQTDEQNEAAKRTYLGAGASRIGQDVLFGWHL
jgi:ribosomal protein S18 acetylase RimI-like enzyme